MGLPCKNQQRQIPVNEIQVYLKNQHNVMTKGCDTPEGMCQITSWISSPCASSLSSYTGSGTSMIQLCFPGSCQPHGLRTYPLLENPSEMPSQLVVISQNDGLSSCFLRVWSHGHSSWVIGEGANPEHSLMCLFIC